MLQSLKYHIFLLPHSSYWLWVEAVRDYVAHFGASVTPSPEKALQFHQPEQTISVVNIPGGYPQYGNVINWLKGQVPSVQLDVLAVSTPEQLQRVLAERVDSGMPLGTAVLAAGQPQSEFCLLWPTDFPSTTQGFGENPELYRRWGLPGHDGIDFEAPTNSHVYACADGEVYLVHDGSGNHPYGIHVRILHHDGYRTIYAHLNQALVHTGQVVEAGMLIGLADSTGNSAGSHMHLTLKKDGATTAGLTRFPYDIIDPAPFLMPVAGRGSADIDQETWPYSHCLVGLVGRLDGPMQEADWSLVQAARVEALCLTGPAVPADIARARSLNPSMFIMARLAADTQKRVLQPADYAHLIAHNARTLYDAGVRYFEIHHEPNLMPEGYGVIWQSGREFGEWFLQVVGLLRPDLPEAKLGWPGLSPGSSVDGMRLDHRVFLQDARSALAQADWIGCHCHWQDDVGVLSEEGGLGYRLCRSLCPDKLVLITEFSNTAVNGDGVAKGNQYMTYYAHLRSQPGVGAAFANAASASAGYLHEVWRSEDGKASPVAGIVGSRTF
jgi:murein DD-endopeptidase MepM/ murein hydrolase activator NlpD